MGKFLNEFGPPSSLRAGRRSIFLECKTFLNISRKIEGDSACMVILQWQRMEKIHAYTQCVQWVVLWDRGIGGLVRFGGGGAALEKKMASKEERPQKNEEKGRGFKRKKAMKKWYEVFINDEKFSCFFSRNINIFDILKQLQSKKKNS